MAIPDVRSISGYLELVTSAVEQPLASAPVVSWNGITPYSHENFPDVNGWIDVRCFKFLTVTVTAVSQNGTYDVQGRKGTLDQRNTTLLQTPVAVASGATTTVFENEVNHYSHIRVMHVADTAQGTTTASILLKP